MADEGQHIRGHSAADIRTAAERALAKAEAARGEVTAAAADDANALRAQRDALREEARIAREEAAETAKRARQAEGRLRAARSRARNLRDTPSWEISAGATGPELEAAQAAHAGRIGKADAAVERAAATAEQAKGTSTAAQTRVAELEELQRLNRRALSAARDAQAAQTRAVRQGEADRAQVRQTAAQAEGRQASSAGVEAVKRAEQEKTAAVAQGSRQRVQLSESERRTIRKAASEGSVRFDPGLVPEQVQAARALEQRGLLEESYRTAATSKKNGSIGYRATSEGISAVDDQGEIRAMRAETAEREIEAARQKLRRVRRDDQKKLYGDLVATYERDIDAYQRFQAEQAAQAPQPFAIAEHNTRRGISYQIREVTSTGSNPVTGLVRTYEEAQHLLNVANTQGRDAVLRAEAELLASKAPKPKPTPKAPAARRFEARPIVDEQGRPIGGIRGAATSSRPLHEIIDRETGRRAEGTGEYTRAENAQRRAGELNKAVGQQATAVERGEQRKTTAVQQGAAKREAASRDEGAVIAGNTAEFERRVREHADILARGLDPEQRARVAALHQPTPAAEQARALAELEAARTAVQRPGTDLIPHPTLAQYPQRQPPPQGRAYRPAGANYERNIESGPRAPLARLEQQLLQAQAAQDESQREWRRMRRANGRGDASDQEVLASEAAHRANVAAVDELRRQRNALRSDIESTIAHTRAQNAATEAMLAEARARPRSPIPDSRALVPFARTGTAIVPTGVSYDDPYSQLSPAERAMLIGGGGGGGGPRLPRPPAPPTPPTPPNGPGPRPQYDVALAERAARIQREYGSAVRDADTALRRWDAQLGIADQSMRRHGTFTTEFIDAARKGDVAYREWGWQIGAAATKFGAWTAAGAGIYGAISAVQKVGQGALDSASGVESVRRTIPNLDAGTAQRQFRSLSTDFAVPISEASDAMMRMGAVFKTQEGAFIGARTALMAFRTGEVDTATATQQLTQIQTGMGVSAQELESIFDRLNYVQNNYGARIPDLLNGTSKLSAAWRQAGGDADYLVAILTAMNRTAGASGDQAATILGRTIGNVNRPSSAKTLQSFGIKPDSTHIEDTIQQAIAVAQRPGTTPEQVQQLAQALAAGHQFQRQWVAILQDPKILNSVLRDESAGKYKGSGQKELDQVMKTWSMRIAELGSQLGNLGSNLAQSGFLTSLGAAATFLTLMLKTVNGLLEVFNLLPQPVKTLAAGIVTVIALMRLARRFGLGGALEGRLGGLGDRVAPYLNEPAGRTARRSISKGLNDAVKSAGDDYESTARAARNAQAVRRRALRSQDVETQEANRRMRLPETHPDHYTPDEGNARIARANERYLRSLDRAAEANLNGVAATEQLRQARKELADYTRQQKEAPRNMRNQRALEFGRQYGLWGPPTLPREYPEAEHVQRFMGMSAAGNPLFSGGNVRLRLDASDLQRQAQSALAAAEGSVISSRRFTLQPGIANVLAANRTTAVQEVGANRARRIPLAGIGQLAGAVFGRGGADAEQVAQLSRGARLQTSMAAAQVAFAAASRTGLDKAKASVETVRPKLAQMRVGMTSLASDFAGLIDPAQLLLAGVLALPGVILAIKGALDADNKRLNDLVRSPKTVEDKKLLMQQLSDASTQGASFGEYWTNLTSHDTPWGAIGALFGKGNDTVKERQTGAAALLDAEKKLAAAQKRARDRGQDVPELTGDEIDHDVNQQVARFQSGRGTIDQAIAAVQKGLREVAKTTKLDDTEKADKKEDLLNQLAQLQKQKQDTLKQEADAQNAALGALIDSGLASKKQIQDFIQRQLELLNKYRNSTTAEGMQAYVSAQQALVNALKNAGSQQLQNALDLAKNAGDVKRAYEHYQAAFDEAAGHVKASAAKPSATERDLDKQLKVARARQKHTEDQQNENPDRLPSGASTTDANNTRKRIEQVKKHVKAEQQRRKANSKALSEEARAIQRERELEEFQGRADYMDAAEAVTEGRADAGLPRLEAQLKEIGRKVQLALKLHLRGTKEFMQLIASQQQARQAIVQEQGSAIEAQTAYNVAAAGSNQAAAGAANIAGLQQLLAFEKGKPNTYSATDVKGVETQILEARTQQADTIRQQATDLLNAQYALKESLNDDPVYQARLEAQRTAAIVQRGGFQTPAERMQAAAEANNARRAAQDAAVQAQISDIDFDVEIGKKTTEQQIAAYERLLKTHQMGQQMKKNLQQQIARLRHQSETDSENFSLDVGNIRLPSVYEVHRAIKEGRSSRQTVVNNSPSVTVNLAPGDDGSTVVRTLDRYLGTSARSAMRASADIGV